MWLLQAVGSQHAWLNTEAPKEIRIDFEGPTQQQIAAIIAKKRQDI